MTCRRSWPPRRLIAAVLCLGVSAAAAAETPAIPRPVPANENGTILGRSVIDSAGADAGLLVDVLVNKNGNPIAGVVNVGGFLGIGMRRVAVAWHLLHFIHTDIETKIQMDLTLDATAAAPELTGPDNTLIVIDRAGP